VSRFVLAIETSGTPASVALAFEGRAPVERSIAGERPDIAKRLIGAIGELIEGAGAARTDLGGLVLGIGPGSYTGLRIGVAAARSLSFASGAPIVAFASTHAMAQSALAEAHGKTAGGPPSRPAAPGAAVLVDALRGDFALALYEWAGDHARETQPPRLVAGAEIAKSPRAFIPAGYLLASNSPELASRALGLEVARAIPTATALLELHRAGAAPMPDSNPLYLRASAAEERARGGGARPAS
jgi:tRNA threonylcarbamoyladenosine biosynthesis protein TsaB